MYWVRGSVSDRILDRPNGRSAYLFALKVRVRRGNGTMGVTTTTPIE